MGRWASIPTLDVSVRSWEARRVSSSLRESCVGAGRQPSVKQECGIHWLTVEVTLAVLAKG
jgi:hypothetical protein